MTVYINIILIRRIWKSIDRSATRIYKPFWLCKSKQIINRLFLSRSSCDIEVVRSVRDKTKDKYNKQQEESLLNSKQNHNQNVNYNRNLSAELNENLVLHSNHQLTPHAIHRQSSTDDRNLITASFDNCNRKFDDLTDCNNCAYSSISANSIDVDLDYSVDDELGTGTEREHEREHSLHLSNATTTGEDNSPNRQIIVRRIRKVRKPVVIATNSSVTTTNVPPKKGSFYDSLVLCMKYILILLTQKLSTFNKTKNSETKMGFLRSMKLKERIVMSFAASLVLFTLFLVIDVQMDFGVTSKHLLPSSSHDKVRYVRNEDSAGFMRDFKRKFLQKRWVVLLHFLMLHGAKLFWWLYASYQILKMRKISQYVYG